VFDQAENRLHAQKALLARCWGGDDGDKRRRQQLLRQLIAERPGSQAEVVAALADAGVGVHEATVSRDLAEVGAVKVRGADGALVYRLPTDARPGVGARAARRHAGAVRDPGHRQRQPRGPAHPTGLRPPGRLRDRPRRPPESSRPSPGDDTVLVVAREGLDGGPRSPPTSLDARAPVREPSGARLRPRSTPIPTPTRLRHDSDDPTTHDKDPDMSKPRIVLAYSGGLDTSVAIRWLQEHKDVDVVACAVDVGQGRGEVLGGGAVVRDDLEEIRQRALDCGAVESVVVDASREFATDFIAPALKANAMYMGKYPLVSALSRPLIVKHLVRVARETGAAGRRARLHRQGQRPGPLRGRHDVPGARPREPGTDPRVGPDARRRDRLGQRAGHPDPDLEQVVALLDRRERLGSDRRVRDPRGPVGRATGGRLRADRGRRRRARQPEEVVIAFERGCRSRSTAARCRCTSWSPRSTSAPARTGSGGST
jgi:hypothetical protein